MYVGAIIISLHKFHQTVCLVVLAVVVAVVGLVVAVAFI